MLLDPWLTYRAMRDEREREVERVTMLHSVRSVLREERGTAAPLDRASRDAAHGVTKEPAARMTRCCAGGMCG